MKLIGAAILSSLLLTTSLGLWLHWKKRRDREGAFDYEIRTAAWAHQLDPALVKAVVWKESRFDPLARGSSGEIGLMQLMEPAAYEWSDANGLEDFVPEHLYDPATNTLAGSYYLAKMLRAFSHCDDPLPYALSSYNAGRSRTLSWIEGGARTNSSQFIDRIGYPSTRQYVLSVLERKRRYQEDFSPRD